MKPGRDEVMDSRLEYAYAYGRMVELVKLLLAGTVSVEQATSRYARIEADLANKTRPGRSKAN